MFSGLVGGGCLARPIPCESIPRLREPRSGRLPPGIRAQVWLPRPPEEDIHSGPYMASTPNYGGLKPLLPELSCRRGAPRIASRMYRCEARHSYVQTLPGAASG